MNDWWLQGGTQTEKHILVLLRFQRCSRYNQTAYHTCYRSYKGQSTERIGAWHEAAPFLNLNYRSAILQASSTTLLSRLNIALLRSTQRILEIRVLIILGWSTLYNKKIAIYCHIDPRIFQHTIEKVWLHFQKDVICIFIIWLNSTCIFDVTFVHLSNLSFL
jgi:hypothetical protein